MQSQLPVDSEIDMEKAMVLWTPQLVSSDSETADGEAQAEQAVEDTDLLNLQSLSLHYPPLTPERPPIITIPASQLALNMEMDDDTWPRDLYEYRGDSSRNIVPFSSPPRYEHEEVDSFSSLPSSPPEYLTGRPEYPYQYSGRGGGRNDERGEEEEEEGEMYEVAHGHSHRAYEGDQPHLVDHDQDPLSQQYYAYDNEPFSSQLPVSDNLCEPPSQLYGQEDYPESEDDDDQYQHHHQQQQYEVQYQHHEEGHQTGGVVHPVKRKYDDYDEHYDLRDDAVHDSYTPPQQQSETRKKKKHKKQKTFSTPAPAPSVVHATATPALAPAPRPITTPPPSDEDAQWQTGKIPGHQGSHSRRANSNEGGSRKRAHGESPTVEKVLKKPFRPPAPKIVLPKVQPTQAASPAPAQHSAPAKAWLSRSAPADRSTTRQAEPAPPSSQDGQAFFDRMRDAQSSPINSNKPKVARAFKPPLLKPASSPSSRASPTTGKKIESVATVIYKLEQEARTLRQAVKYHTDMLEDERLVDLIHQWRTAGRDVVEQMFDRVPKPDPTAQQAMPHSSSSSSWFFGDSAGNQHDQLTEEQRRFLKHCAKNEDGEPIDDEGNPILGEPEDLGSMMQRACAPRPGETDDYIPMDRGEATSGTRVKGEAPKEWNMGTMMLRYQVDPALLGWDDDTEDWAEVNESL